MVLPLRRAFNCNFSLTTCCLKLSVRNSSIYSLIRKLPVIKAFCNCPLNPVFHGLIAFTARLFHRQNMITKILTNKSTPNIITMYFQTFPLLVPEAPSLVEGPSFVSFPLEPGEGSDAGD